MLFYCCHDWKVDSPVDSAQLDDFQIGVENYGKDLLFHHNGNQVSFCRMKIRFQYAWAN